MRYFRAQSFPGSRFLNLVDAVAKPFADRCRRGLLPVRADPVEKEVIRTIQIEEMYGYRGQDERVYF